MSIVHESRPAAHRAAATAYVVCPLRARHVPPRSCSGHWFGRSHPVSNDSQSQAQSILCLSCVRPVALHKLFGSGHCQARWSCSSHIRKCKRSVRRGNAVSFIFRAAQPGWLTAVAKVIRAHLPMPFGRCNAGTGIRRHHSRARLSSSVTSAWPARWEMGRVGVLARRRGAPRRDATSWVFGSPNPADNYTNTHSPTGCTSSAGANSENVIGQQLRVGMLLCMSARPAVLSPVQY